MVYIEREAQSVQSMWTKALNYVEKSVETWTKGGSYVDMSVEVRTKVLNVRKRVLNCLEKSADLWGEKCWSMWIKAMKCEQKC